MIQIDYINGDSETVESKESDVTKYWKAHFRYDAENTMFIVFTSDNERDCMMIPREFVKSIRFINIENND